MTKELANASRLSRRKRAIRNIPAFQLHLEREGISFEEFERRQRAALSGTDATSLSLQAQRARLGR